MDVLPSFELDWFAVGARYVRRPGPCRDALFCGRLDHDGPRSNLRTITEV